MGSSYGLLRQKNSDTLDPNLARELCMYQFSHLAGMDPGYVWDQDIETLPSVFYREGTQVLRSTHVACQHIAFPTIEHLALHWNRFHVASVPSFKCPIEDSRCPHVMLYALLPALGDSSPQREVGCPDVASCGWHSC